MMSMDAIAGAIYFIEAEYGHTDDGYYIEAIAPWGRRSVKATVVHRDGSRFVVACNHYGVPLDPTTAEPYHYDGGRWHAP